MSTLNTVLSGLHETDVKLNTKLQSVYNGVGLSAIQTDEATSAVIPLLDENSKINPVYNSMSVASIENPQGDSGVSKIQFIGDCKVTPDGNGGYVVRIGPNLNKSNFNTTDGEGTGIPSSVVSSGAQLAGHPAADLNYESGIKMYNGNVTLQIRNQANNPIHFDSTSGTFTLDVYVNGSAASSIVFEYDVTQGSLENRTGNGNFQGKIDGADADIYLAISNFGNESRTAEGATGYQGEFSVTFDKCVAVANNGKIALALTDGNNRTYGPITAIWVTNSSTVPSVNNATITYVPGSTTKTNSGITYDTDPKAKVEANVADINNPGYVDKPVNVTGTMINGDSGYKAVTKTGNNAADTADLDLTYNVKTGYWAAGQTATIKVKNAIGETSVTTAGTESAIIADRDTSAGPTNVAEHFRDETNATYGRLYYDDTQNTFSAFDNTADIENTNDLMVSCGTLKYPSGFGKSFDSGIRYYCRKFCPGAGTYFGGKFTFAGLNDTGWNSSSFEAKFSKDGVTWYNLKTDQGGADPLGTKVSFSSGTVTFAMPGVAGASNGEFDGADGIYLKVAWGNSDNINITDITFSNN